MHGMNGSVFEIFCDCFLVVIDSSVTVCSAAGLGHSGYHTAINRQTYFSCTIATMADFRVSPGFFSTLRPKDGPNKELFDRS